MSVVDVPGEVDASGRPWAGPDEILEREPCPGLVVGDLDIVGTLPDGSGLELETES